MRITLLTIRLFARNACSGTVRIVISEHRSDRMISPQKENAARGRTTTVTNVILHNGELIYD